MNYKIRVHNEQHSRAIQELLFSKGYKRSNGERFVGRTLEPYIYIDNDYGIGIHFGYDENYFLKSKHKEITLDYIYSDEFIGIETIMLNDECKAIINSNGVEIENQKISFDKIEELYEAIFNNKSS